MNRLGSIQPIYLLADSQLLFWRTTQGPFFSQLGRTLNRLSPSAAYVGASNRDDPQFYSIFTAAMEVIGVADCRMIKSSFSDEDRRFFESADIILLAGGDVRKGWDVIERVGIKEALCRRYHNGAVLLGVSAGAVHLGQYGFCEENGVSTSLFDTLSLIPFAVDVHQEHSDWERLSSMIRVLDSGVTGLGIPSGGGMIYHPDHTIEPVRFPVYEFAIKDQELTRTLLFPAKENEEPGKRRF